MSICLVGCGVFDYTPTPTISMDSTNRIKDPLSPSKPSTPNDTTKGQKSDTIKIVIPPQKDTIKTPIIPPVKNLYTILDEFLINNSYKYDNNIMVFIHNGDSAVYTYRQGKYEADNVLPIASSTKWITAAVIMSLVDQKKLSLNDNIGKYLPIYNQYGKGEITIKQLFSHTSGIVSDSPFDERGEINLKASVDSIAIYTQLLFPPGKGVKYGSCAYKIAARIAEIIEGKDWKSIFEERIANKCEMKNVVFSPLSPQNPHTGAGIFCSLNQYVKFLAMIHNRGLYKGVRVLSEEAIKEMEKDQSNNLNALYGLGLWRYQINNGLATEVSSPSAMGVHPWVNRDKRYFGIIFTQAGFDKTYDTNLAFRSLVQGLFK